MNKDLDYQESVKAGGKLQFYNKRPSVNPDNLENLADTLKKIIQYDYPNFIIFGTYGNYLDKKNERPQALPYAVPDEVWDEVFDVIQANPDIEFLFTETFPRFERDEKAIEHNKIVEKRNRAIETRISQLNYNNLKYMKAHTKDALIHPVTKQKTFQHWHLVMKNEATTVLPGVLWVAAQLILTNFCRKLDHFEARNLKTTPLPERGLAQAQKPMPGTSYERKPYDVLEVDEAFYSAMKNTPRFNWNELDSFRYSFFRELDIDDNMHVKPGILYQGYWNISCFYEKRTRGVNLKKAQVENQICLDKFGLTYSVPSKKDDFRFIDKNSVSKTAKEWNSWPFYKQGYFPWLNHVVKWDQNFKTMFDRTSINHCLINKRITVIGDSRMRQSFMTLRAIYDNNYLVKDGGGHYDQNLYKNNDNQTVIANFIWEDHLTGPNLENYLNLYKPKYVVLQPTILHYFNPVAKIPSDPVYLLEPIYEELVSDWDRIIREVMAKFTGTEFVLLAAERSHWELQMIQRNYFLRKFNHYLYNKIEDELNLPNVRYEKCSKFRLYFIDYDYLKTLMSRS